MNYYLKIKPEFTIELEYTNGKGNYTISQSQVFGESKDPFSHQFVVPENIEQYELEGIKYSTLLITRIVIYKV